MRIICQKLSTQNFTSDFIGHMLFAQILLSQNSKGKYESRKILDFVKKYRKIDFFRNFKFLLLFLLLFSYFEVFILLFFKFLIFYYF
jgi:hypothetical protein